MSASPALTSAQPSKWKLPLIGGVTALLVNILVFFYVEIAVLTPVWLIAGFLWIFRIPLPGSDLGLVHVLVSAVLWFLFGMLIAGLVKGNPLRSVLAVTLAVIVLQIIGLLVWGSFFQY